MQKKQRRSRGTMDLLGGLAEIESLLRDGAKVEDRFIVHTVEFPDPHEYSPKAIKRLRGELAMSQEVFAHLIGVSRMLVQGWERGVREPSPLARRLLDTICRDPAAWLDGLQREYRKAS